MTTTSASTPSRRPPRPRTPPRRTTTDGRRGATTTEAPAGEPGTTVAQVDDPWKATAVQFRAEPIGTEHEFECPGGGEPDTVWGTDIYTDDSSVCTAAVHAGAITVEDGGTVTIRLEGEQDSFEASERNGIASLEYPAWPGSFSVVDA